MKGTRSPQDKAFKSATFKEARRLYDLGFAIHWLHPKSKRPIESGWTTGPRKSWEYLTETYVEGLNVGVRLGDASQIQGKFLAVIDVDVKSEDPRHRKEAVRMAKSVLKSASAPVAVSGRGNGSRHYYFLSDSPFKTFNPASSEEYVEYFSPSKKPSKKELERFTPKEIKAGLRLARAWEISLYSNGRQVVLPPSIHPDSGKAYAWGVGFTDVGSIPIIEVPEGIDGDAKDPNREAIDVNERSERMDLNFKVEPVDLAWLPISDSIREGIVHGTNVKDRSGYLLQASTALISAGLTQNEVLTVLTDPNTFIGACAYDHAQTKSRDRAAAWVHRYTFKKVAAERSPELAFKDAPILAARKLSPEEIEEQNEELGEERNWRQDIIRGGPKGDGPPKGIIENIVLILKNAISPEIVRRNLFAFRDSYGVETPWRGKVGTNITDDDVALIRFWLSKNFGFEPKKEIISDALTVIACDNAYDPVIDFLNDLPDWDGVNRLDTWLARNFEAQGDPEYLAQVFRKWMVAMVMRAYLPGVKFDWMPIFEGAQGVGKSSFGRLLVGDDYFLDWLPNLADKDSALALQGMWGVEMGELANMRRNELEPVKAYVTRKTDKVRPPFGRRWLEMPRRCVFFGTTNKSTYLTDDSGNRRFKPLLVGRLEFDVLKEERMQLFAEAKHLYESFAETEETLELTGNAKIFEDKIQGEKMVEDEASLMAEAMQDFIKKVQQKEAVFDFKKFRSLDLFSGVGPLQKWQINNRNSQFASKMLKKLGGKQRMIHGLRFWDLPNFSENRH